MGDGGFPWGRVAALGVVVGLTFLPVVSCGPLEFQGHELLRNEPPDFDQVTSGITSGLEDLGRSLQGGAGAEGSHGAPATTPRVDRGSKGTVAKRGRIFEGDEAWMHWLYVAVFALGVLGLFPPAGSRLKAALAALGLAGLVLFLQRFQTALVGEEGREAAQAGLVAFEWDAGAYVAAIGFALVLIDGLRRPVG